MYWSSVKEPYRVFDNLRKSFRVKDMLRPIEYYTM